MLQSESIELRKREIQGTRILCVIGCLLIAVSYLMGWESGPGIYLGFLGGGTLLSGIIVIPLSIYLNWLYSKAPDWFREIGFLVAYAAAIAVVVLFIFVMKRF